MRGLRPPQNLDHLGIKVSTGIGRFIGVGSLAEKDIMLWSLFEKSSWRQATQLHWSSAGEALT